MMVLHVYNTPPGMQSPPWLIEKEKVSTIHLSSIQTHRESIKS